MDSNPAFSGIPGNYEYYPAIGDGTLAGGGSFAINFGQRPFAYTPPTGFKSLSTPSIHQSTDWQLSTDPGFTTLVQSSIADTVNRTSWPIADLALDTDYYLRCRYTNTVYGTSEWSTTQHFHTRSTWLPVNEMQILTASDKVASDYFGASVALTADGSRMVVGAYYRDVAGVVNAGQVYIYTRTGSVWTLESTLSASDKASNDYFGYSVALTATGDRLAVGAYGRDSGVVDGGQVYIYTRVGCAWTQESTLASADRVAYDYFGFSVALTADGSRLVVGAYGRDVAGIVDAGQVYVYTRIGSTWTLESILSASDKAASDYFGASVALTADGSRMAVGALYKDVAGIVNAGQVYIYTRVGSVWTQESTLTASDKAASDFFGASVALTADGSRMAVGTHSRDVSGVVDAGQVYIYTRIGSAWTLESMLSAADRATSDYYGRSVALTATGDRLAVGAYGRDVAGIADAGQVYVYTRSGSVWTLESTLSVADRATNDYYGSSVALTADGSRIAVGAYCRDVVGVVNAGQVYIYTRSGSTWTLESTLSASDRATNDYYGASVALTADGSRIAVGALFKDVAGVADTGQVYMYS